MLVGRSTAAACASLLAFACSRPVMAPAPLPAALQARARLLRIEDTRRDEPAFIDSLLRGGDDSLRGAAALAAARIGSRAHLAGIRALVSVGTENSAADALFALALLRDTSALGIASSALAGQPATGVEAANLLGAIGEPARAAVMRGLADPRLAPATRGALLLAAAKLRPVPAAAVIPFVSSTDTALAWSAAYALSRGRSAAGVRAMLAASASASGGVREQAARALARSLAGDSLADSALSRLRIMVRDTEPRVRINAIRALATYGAAARAVVMTSLADRNPHVRRTAAESLNLVLDSTAGGWLTALQSDTAFVVQRTVVEGAARRGIELGVLAPWRVSPDWRTRSASLEIDAALLQHDVLDRIAPALRSDDARIRAAAVGALGTVAASRDSLRWRDSVRALARSALRDPDFQVRATALGILASGATRGDLASALDAEPSTRGDRDLDARLAFWALADSVLRRDPGALAALDDRLAALPRPADPLERAAAARIPRFAQWSDVTGTPRPFAWYEERAREAGDVHPPIARIETERGTIELLLFAADAPLTVFNFDSLARSGYFDGQRFHRVVPNFVVQAGDPRGDGNGGPGYAIRDELNRHRYERGTLGMALSGPNTGGSQFFITHSPQPHLDGGYTVFGQFLSGGDVLDRIVQGDRIVHVSIH